MIITLKLFKIWQHYKEIDVFHFKNKTDLKAKLKHNNLHLATLLTYISFV